MHPSEIGRTYNDDWQNSLKLFEEFKKNVRRSGFSSLILLGDCLLLDPNQFDSLVMRLFRACPEFAFAQSMLMLADGYSHARSNRVRGNGNLFTFCFLTPLQSRVLNKVIKIARNGSLTQYSAAQPQSH